MKIQPYWAFIAICSWVLVSCGLYPLHVNWVESWNTSDEPTKDCCHIFRTRKVHISLFYGSWLPVVQINFMQIKSNGIDKYLRRIDSVWVYWIWLVHTLSRKWSWVKTMKSQKSCDSRDQVFLKHKSKMTGDCSVFKFLQHSVDGAYVLPCKPYFPCHTLKNACVLFLCSSITFSFCDAFQGFIRLDMSEYQEKHEVRVQEILHEMFLINICNCCFSFLILLNQSNTKLVY